MSAVWSNIKSAIASEKWIVSYHAAMRLRQRRVASWQVASGAAAARLLAVREDAEPNPSVEVQVELPDGAACRCVWAWLSDDRAALLVTVYFGTQA
ncbi:MAG: DUF4258 domain-containing protein [Phycisphaerales bacterium]